MSVHQRKCDRCAATRRAKCHIWQPLGVRASSFGENCARGLGWWTEGQTGEKGNTERKNTMDEGRRLRTRPSVSHVQGVETRRGASDRSCCWSRGKKNQFPFTEFFHSSDLGSSRRINTEILNTVKCSILIGYEAANHFYSNGLVFRYMYGRSLRFQTKVLFFIFALTVAVNG